MAKQQQEATGVFTADFREGFHAETRRMLRPRFLWFTGVLLTFQVVSLAFAATMIALAVNVRGGAQSFLDGFAEAMEQAGLDQRTSILLGAATALYLGVYALGFLYALVQRPDDRTLLRITMAVVVCDGLIAVGMRWLELPGGIGLFGFMISHFLASLFLPWSARQAMVPVAIVIGVSAVSRLLLEGQTLFNNPGGFVTADADLFWIPFGALTGLPGVTVCWLRHSRRLNRYSHRYFRERYGEMRRELVDARRIHEALFPKQIEDGPVRMRYAYEPMRQIGGDFLFIREGPDGRVSAAILDVTGHGIPAALTVNRLHGELERVFAENPEVRPGEVLALLNRYVHLTLAGHSVYVTGVCLRVDPRDSGELEFASGGHPPAFLLGVDGSIEQLDSTTFVLGAVPPEDFEPEPRTLRFAPGDSIVAYTDGATECRNQHGKMLGVAGLQRLVAGGVAQRGGWAEAFRSHVDGHRFGPIDDDTLVIELFRPLD